MWLIKNLVHTLKIPYNGSCGICLRRKLGSELLKIIVWIRSNQCGRFCSNTVGCINIISFLLCITKLNVLSAHADIIFLYILTNKYTNSLKIKIFK